MGDKDGAEQKLEADRLIVSSAGVPTQVSTLKLSPQAQRARPVVGRPLQDQPGPGGAAVGDVGAWADARAQGDGRGRRMACTVTATSQLTLRPGLYTSRDALGRQDRAVEVPAYPSARSFLSNGLRAWVWGLDPVSQDAG